MLLTPARQAAAPGAGAAEPFLALGGGRAVDPRTGTVVAADARIDNRTDLRAALGLSAPPPSDAELILHAYRAWGDAAADRLVGDFAFAIWDPVRSLVTAARDPAATRPLYFRSLGERFLVASLPGPLAREAPVALDGYAAADFFCLSARPSSRTLLAEVRKVPPGHVLRHDGRGTTLRRFWHPASGNGGRAADGGEWCERLREALDRAVRDRLEDAGGAVAVLLSGGIDSSSVAATAARGLRAAGRQGSLVAYSHVYPGWPGCDEGRYSSGVAEALGIERHELPAGDAVPPLEPDPALADLEPWAALYEASGGEALDRARERGCSLVLTGFGGDCLFDAARYRYWEDVRAGRWWRLAPWIRAARERGDSSPSVLRSLLIKPLLPWPLRHRLDGRRGAPGLRHAPPWLGADLRRRSRPEERLRRRTGAPAAGGAIARSRYRHVLDLGMQAWSIESWAALAARRGLRMGHPLLDRRVLELVLRSPLSLGSRPGPAGSKWLLRRAMRGRVPEAILARSDKGSWGPYLRHRLADSRGRIVERLRAGVLAELGLLDPAALERELEAYCTGAATRLRSPLVFLPPLLLELWLAAGGLAVTGVRYPEALDFVEPEVARAV